MGGERDADRRPSAVPGPQLRLLGSFSLSVGGVPTPLGARKARALLALLALEGPQSREVLADILWGDLGDMGARKNLRKLLHALRGTGLSADLDTDSEVIGCRLGYVDALEFERLAAAGDLEQAMLVGEGVLLEGLEIASEAWNIWLDACRNRLAGRLREVRLEVAAEREAHGDVRGALSVLLRLLDTDAFEEHAVREVMRLHLRLGERAQATALFKHFGTLAASLDLEPEAATQLLAERACRPSPQAQTDAGRVPTHRLRGPLVGREAAWLHLSRSDARLILLVGEPGVGKTRLASEFAGAHAEALIMRGREETRQTPFSPVAHLIREALMARVWLPESLADVWRLEVARLIPECAPDSVLPPVTAEGRSRFLEGLARAVMSVLAGQMLVLDDLHWFDEGTLELVSYLVRRWEGLRIVATARILELEASSPAARTVEGLRRDGLAQPLLLEPLGEADVLALVQGLSGAGGGTLFARRLHAASHGNPLYILELLRGLLETGLLAPAPEGGWATPFDESTHDYAELPIPSSLRDTVLERVNRLGRGARRLLDCAALAGDPFESAWLTGIEADEWVRLEVLEAACRAEVLEAVNAGFHFRHELLRRTLDEALTPERRRATHHRLAQQLQGSQAPPERIAAHFERAGRGEDALPYLEAAAEAASQVYAFGQVVSYNTRMLDHERDLVRRGFLERRRLWFLNLVSDPQTYQAHLTDFGQAAKRSGDPNRQAEHHFMRGLFHLLRSQPRELADHSAAMLALPDLSAESRVNALYLDGHAQTFLGRSALALERFSEALRLRRRHAGGNETSITAGNIENGLTRACLSCGAFGRAATHNARALAAFEGTTDVSLIYALNGQAHLAALEGRYETARRVFARAMSLASQRGDAGPLTWVLRHRAALLLALGEADAALDDIGETLRLSAGQYLRVEASVTGLRAEALRLQGRLGEALSSAREAVAALAGSGAANADPAMIELRLILGHLLLACGDVASARTELEAVRSLDDAAQGLSLQVFSAALGSLAARLELALGQPGRALKQLRATPHLENAPALERAAHAAELARALLLCGDAATALAGLGNLAPPPLAPRFVDVQLSAHLALGTLPPPLLASALALIQHQGAAPTDRLELMASVIRALEAERRDASAVQALAQTTLLALAERLEGHPEQRSGLLKRFEHLKLS
ncbi:ATP-binding protein [Deinococcus sp.]|uniref:ATP-binding protein n=1 Tax=Deinococcus sp. TaxID=47478 RepID=UPI003B599297